MHGSEKCIKTIGLCGYMHLSSQSYSIHPFSEVVAAFESCRNFCRVHLCVFGNILGVLPLEELDAILCDRLTSKVAIGCSLLVLWLTQCKRHRNCTWATV